MIELVLLNQRLHGQRAKQLDGVAGETAMIRHIANNLLKTIHMCLAGLAPDPKRQVSEHEDRRHAP